MWFKQFCGPLAVIYSFGNTIISALTITSCIIFFLSDPWSQSNEHRNIIIVLVIYIIELGVAIPAIIAHPLLLFQWRFLTPDKMCPAKFAQIFTDRAEEKTSWLSWIDFCSLSLSLYSFLTMAFISLLVIDLNELNVSNNIIIIESIKLFYVLYVLFYRFFKGNEFFYDMYDWKDIKNPPHDILKKHKSQRNKCCYPAGYDDQNNENNQDNQDNDNNIRLR